jgi:PKD repeat protein
MVLEPGDCYTINKTVQLPLIPPQVDVVFSFDLTFSMLEILNTAKSKAGDIMNTLITSYPEVSFYFGVMSHMDYPDYYTSCSYSKFYGASNEYAYSLDQTLTSDIASVIAAINSLSIGYGGGDTPEDYTRALFESYNDSNIDWREDTKQLLVSFGDNVPHDCNINEGIYPTTKSTGNDPGPDEIMDTSDDLDLQTVLGEMNSNGIILIACQTEETYYDYWDYWSGLTGGGVHITNSSTLVDDVVTAITSGLTNLKIYNLTLEVTTPGYSSWLTSVDPPIYPQVISGSTVIFNETICVPLGTPTGIYTFNVSAVDEDDIIYGNQTNTISVNYPPVANNDTADTIQDIAVWINVTENDYDDDGTLNLSTVTITDFPSDGITFINPITGEIQYMPNPNFYGVDSFNYTVDDDDGFTSNEATVNISVQEIIYLPGGGGPTYDPPIADANGPYYGFLVDGIAEIEFNGSGSTGTISSYIWDFGDGKLGNGVSPTHSYTTIGKYIVNLTISGLVGSDTNQTYVIITDTPNYPPGAPTIDGPTTGHKNTSYDFTVVSSDIDNNTIKYTFNWGDGETTTTDFIENGISVIRNHSWAKYGKYTITVKAYDNLTESLTRKLTILIDVLPIDDEIVGILIDLDSDGIFDIFNNSVTGTETDVGKENNTYLIDIEGDGKWDYSYSLNTGELSTYTNFIIQKYLILFDTEIATPGFELISLLAMIALTVIILKRRKNR